jgi:phytanoyl-CoA hydroxylase
VNVERHPWNTGFVWRDHLGPFRVVTEEQAHDYDTHGFFVVEDAFDPDTVAEVADALAPLDREIVDFLRTQPDGRFDIAGVDTVTIALHPSLRNRVLHDFCGARLFAELCIDLIGPDARLYWDQAVFKQPHGAEPVLWHQDNGYTYVEPQAYLTCWVALTDATLDNGCVWVLPGIHRGETLAHRDTPIGFECCTDDEARAAGAVPVPVRAGSIVVFSSLTPHATGRNLTGDVRKAYILQYAPDGAVARRGDPSGSPGPPEPQNDPERQFLVARDGEPIEPRARPR